MKVEERSISSIRPYEHNPRVNDQAVDAVAASIREYGFRQPLVLDDGGVIVVGHARYKAALKLGLETVPVHIATGLTAAQLKAYRLADNQSASLSHWDDGRLISELAELQKANFDLNLTGFSADELLRLTTAQGLEGASDPDQIPEPPEEPTTKPGDIWQLGRHRLMCGDAAKAEDVDRLLEGVGIELVVSDPPYNVRVAPRTKNALAAGLSSFPSPSQQHSGGRRQRRKVDAGAGRLRARDRPLTNDYLSEEAFDKCLHAWFANMARVLLPGRSFYLWGGYANCANYPAARANQLYFSQAIIWVKEHPVISRKDYMGNHEWCFYGWREGAGHSFFGPNNISDVWSVKKISPLSMLHLTEKPTELSRRALEYSSRPGENVLDLFAGSGPMLIAAEQTGRRAYLMEIDPLYCDIIVTRWEQFTSQKAVLSTVQNQERSGNLEQNEVRNGAARATAV